MWMAWQKAATTSRSIKTRTSTQPRPMRPRRRKSRLSKGARSTIEWVVVIGAALIVALVRTFLLAALYIPSESMESTLNIGDRVLVNKLSYHLHDVHRGDVVVFRRPPGESDATIKDHPSSVP